MVTIYDIAKYCGVSPATVSKTINNYSSVSKETKKRISEAMVTLNYIPNSSAKSLSKGVSHNIGVLTFFGLDISPFRHPLFGDILDSFQKEMCDNGYDLLFISRNVAGRHESFLKNIISRNVDGVILFGDLAHPEMQEIISSTIPCVGFDYYGGDMPSVVSNNYQAMFHLSEHLIFHGHKNIVFVHGEKNEVTNLRIKAFKDTLVKHNIKFMPHMLYETLFADKDRIERITRDIVSRNNIPTAIMYPDDFCAIQGTKVLKSLGFRVPEDISVTGFDGIELTQLVTPTITTFKQDTVKIGKLLAQNLIQAMENKIPMNNTNEVMGELLIGQSTADAYNKID